MLGLEDDKDDSQEQHRHQHVVYHSSPDFVEETISEEMNTAYDAKYHYKA